MELQVLSLFSMSTVVKIRLVGSNSSTSGHVEVKRDGGRWGSFSPCKGHWGRYEADTACKMLGYARGKANIGNSFGHGSGPIWLNDLQCTGHERNINWCVMSEWGNNQDGCTHHDDAGLTCFKKRMSIQKKSAYFPSGDQFICP